MPASDMAMATACFRSVTIGPRLLPLCNIPALYSFMTFLTLPRFLLPSSESGISVIRRQEHGCREADDGPRRPELGVGRARQANLGHAAGDADIEELRYRKTADSADGRAARDDVSGPADRAGLRGGNRSVVVGRYRFLVGGDIITTIDGQPMSSMLSLNRLIYRKRPGDEVEITYYRGKEKRTVKVTLEERPQQVRR